MPISRQYLISTTFILLFVGGVALIGLAGATAWLSQRAQVYSDLVNAQRLIRGYASNLREGLLLAETNQRGFVITNNEIYLAPYENAEAIVKTELANLRNDPNARDRFARMMPRLTELVELKVGEMDNLVRLTKAGAANQAIALIVTNEGKSLIDEVTVFLSAIVLESDDAILLGLREQTASISSLRIGAVAAAILIALVVTGVVVLFSRYSTEIAQIRDELYASNANLEIRVAERTDALARARDRAEVLLTEVNHRVANSLAFVVALINMQRQSMADPAARAALDETRTRIQAVGEIHKHLYTSGDVTSVSLDKYMDALLTELGRTLASDGNGGSIRQEIEPVRIATSACINLGIIVTEWVTNAMKYAYGGQPGEVRVRARRMQDQLLMAVEDDGIGIAANAPARGTGVGSKIVATIAKSLAAEVSYISRAPGTEARLMMPMAVA